MTTRNLLLSLEERLFGTLLGLILDLSDAQLGYAAPIIDARPLADVALHIYHSLWGFTSIAVGQAWPPPPTSVTNQADLLGELNTMRSQVHEQIAQIVDTAWHITVRLPWDQECTVADAILDGLTHGFVHAGHIGGIRAIGGFPTQAEEY